MSKLPKSPRKARFDSTNLALQGECVPSFSTSFQGQLRAHIDEHLPAAKYVLETEFCRVMGLLTRSIINTLGNNFVVAVDRQTAERVILSALPINAPKYSLSGLPDASEKVREFERRLIEATDELIELNRKIEADGATYEEFCEAKGKVLFPNEVSALLKASEIGGMVELCSPVGKLKLSECRRVLKSLPSSQIHTFNCRVQSCAGASGGTNFSIEIIEFVEPKDSKVGDYTKLDAFVLDKSMRNILVEAFRLDVSIQLTCKLLQVPLVFDIRQSLIIDILSVEPIDESDKELS